MYRKSLPLDGGTESLSHGLRPCQLPLTREPNGAQQQTGCGPRADDIRPYTRPWGKVARRKP